VRIGSEIDEELRVSVVGHIVVRYRGSSCSAAAVMHTAMVASRKGFCSGGAASQAFWWARHRAYWR
jgi:hypothetical protein